MNINQLAREAVAIRYPETAKYGTDNIVWIALQFVPITKATEAVGVQNMLLLLDELKARTPK